MLKRILQIFRSPKNPRLFAAQASDLQMSEAARKARIRPHCECLELSETHDGLKKIHELQFHAEVQDRQGDAWKLIESLVQEAIQKKSKEFAPGLVMPPELWSQIMTLPPSIAELKYVRKLYLYGSHLIRLPVEIGEMENLEELDIYTSYKLHWLPYEITRCRKLRRSRASTRALYGNYKYRPPFPHLINGPIEPGEGNCSVCDKSCSSVHRVWISLRVATDVFPLLVHACSEECIKQLPHPEQGYVDHPHMGGLEVAQPQRKY
jgi:hypothetical protein